MGIQYALLLGSISDKEMVRLCHDMRMRSPLIDELCNRLEELIPVNPHCEDEDGQEPVCLVCPVCQSSLVYDPEDGTLI